MNAATLRWVAAQPRPTRGPALGPLRGGLKESIPPVLYFSYAQVPSSPLQQMTFALRTDGEPLRLIESFLFYMKPNDPRALALAVAILLSAALLAGYGPARRKRRKSIR